MPLELQIMLGLDKKSLKLQNAFEPVFINNPVNLSEFVDNSNNFYAYKKCFYLHVCDIL
jgi:hypothetical protein